MRFQIRPARPEDTEAIFRIRTSVVENTLSLAELADLGITPDAITAMITASPCAWLAISQGHAVGFAMIDADAACLFAAFVQPDQEGHGIGRALVETCEAALFQRHPLIWLETARDSRAAGFYRRLGWGSETPTGDGDIRLEKRLEKRRA